MQIAYSLGSSRFHIKYPNQSTKLREMINVQNTNINDELRKYDAWIKNDVATDADYCNYRFLNINLLTEIGRVCAQLVQETGQSIIGFSLTFLVSQNGLCCLGGSRMLAATALQRSVGLS